MFYIPIFLRYYGQGKNKFLYKIFNYIFKNDSFFKFSFLSRTFFLLLLTRFLKIIHRVSSLLLLTILHPPPLFSNLPSSSLSRPQTQKETGASLNNRASTVLTYNRTTPPTHTHTRTLYISPYPLKLYV